MRSPVPVLLCSLCALPRAAVSEGLAGRFWQPPDLPAPFARARSAFEGGLAARGGKSLPEPLEAGAAGSLASRLAPPLEHYRAFRFSEAVAELTELGRAVEAAGGADLDGRQLSDLFLYRGLARQEAGDPTGAWEDLVRAARLDPSRTLDPAQVPPRALGAFRRAAAEAAQQARGELELRVPDGARVTIDGRPASGVVALGLGPHLGRVEAPGYEPWSGTLAVAGSREVFAPALRLRQPPDADALIDQARRAGLTRGRLVLGAVRRVASGWRLLVRVVAVPGGRSTSEEVALEGAPVEAAVEGALRGLLDATPAAPPAAQPRRSRVWIWAVVGSVAVALAVALPIGIVYGTPSSTGVVGGPLEPIK